MTTISTQWGFQSMAPSKVGMGCFIKRRWAISFLVVVLAFDDIIILLRAGKMMKANTYQNMYH